MRPRSLPVPAAPESTAAVAFIASLGCAAGAGALFTVGITQTPKRISAMIYVILGCAGVALLGRLPSTIGWLAVSGLLLGGGLYSTGALIYAKERPNPAPAVFGYHEIFHALVIAAARLQYSVIAFAVLPHGR